MSDVSIFGWLNLLFEWISLRFKRKRRRRHPHILKKHYSGDCALLRVERETRGAVGTYRAIPRNGDWDYLLTLDSLREIEAELAGEFNGVPFLLRSRSDYTAPSLSHRLAVFHVYRTGTCRLLGCWDINLQALGRGTSSQAAIMPERIFYSAVVKILRIHSRDFQINNYPIAFKAGEQGAGSRGRESRFDSVKLDNLFLGVPQLRF